jgi:O-antigen/teichoic acid export membrane protein
MADNSYKSIAKANALFGGVQVFNILIGIIRSKIVAVLLGPEGIGIVGLLQSTVDLVKSFTNMGLQTSAVRDVTLATETGDMNRVAVVKEVVSKWVWLTGLLGTAVMFLFSPKLSEWAFGNDDYSIHLKILSVVLLINQLTVGFNVVLQGSRQLKTLASTNMIGGVLGLLINVPIYYIWGIDGAVAVLILAAISSNVLAWYGVRKMKIQRVRLSLSEIWHSGNQMVKMGFLIGLTGLFDMVSVYVLKAYVQSIGGLVDVGLYTAGFGLVTSYMGLIFGAIGTDYYPRLTSVSNSEKDYNDVINKQFELMILVLMPLVLFFVMFSPLILQILYSDKFVPAFWMINWVAVGMIFRALSWCPGFMYLAKNDSKLYFAIYVFEFTKSLLVYIGGYYFGGLSGLGVAFLINYVTSSALTIIITRVKYNVRLTPTSYRLTAMATLLAAITLVAVSWESPLRYAVFVVLLSATTAYSAYQLNKKMGIVEMIKGRWKGSRRSPK